MSVPTAIELRATLVTLVASTTGTRVGRWEQLIGEVEMLPLALHSRCNWSIAIGGVEDERRVLDAAIEFLQLEHPYVGMDASPSG